MQLSNGLFAFGGLGLIAWSMATPGLFGLLVSWHAGWLLSVLTKKQGVRLLFFGAFFIVFCLALCVTSFTSGMIAMWVDQARFGKWQYGAYAFFAIDAVFWVKQLWTSFPPLPTPNDDDGQG